MQATRAVDMAVARASGMTSGMAGPAPWASARETTAACCALAAFGGVVFVGCSGIATARECIVEYAGGAGGTGGSRKGEVGKKSRASYAPLLVEVDVVVHGEESESGVDVDGLLSCG